MTTTRQGPTAAPADANGSAGPAPVLAGHLVIYDDPPGLAFRPDDDTDGQVLIRPMILMAVGQLVELFTPGEGGMLAAVMRGKMPNMNPKMVKQMRAAARAEIQGDGG